MTAPLGRLVSIPDTDQGTAITLDAMRRLARERAKTPAVANMALGIECNARRTRGVIAGLAGFLSRSVQFQRDPDGVEYVRDPLVMLGEYKATGRTHGDCDDVACLAATIALALGLHVRLVVLKFAGPASPYLHVYAEVAEPVEPATFTALDTTAPAQTFAASPTYRAVMPV